MIVFMQNKFPIDNISRDNNCLGCSYNIDKDSDGHSHYSDVIISAVASQITNLTIVYSTVYSGADERNHQSSASLAFVRGIHRWPVNSPHKEPVTRKMFPFDDVMARIKVFSQQSWKDQTRHMVSVAAVDVCMVTYDWEMWINLNKLDSKITDKHVKEQRPSSQITFSYKFCLFYGSLVITKHSRGLRNAFVS